MDDMLQLYVKKRQEYEKIISLNLENIEKSVLDLCSVGDYFSIKNDEELITIKTIVIDDNKHIAIRTEHTPEFIALNKLTLSDNPDLILWIIENKAIIEQGFKEVLINTVRNGENIINTLNALNIKYDE